MQRNLVCMQREIHLVDLLWKGFICEDLLLECEDLLLECETSHIKAIEQYFCVAYQLKVVFNV